MRILVAGDMMIDRYTYVESTRRAQEADIPVWDTYYEEDRLGGAANVANNVKALCSDETWLMGIVSRDLLDLFDGMRIGAAVFGESMVKHRIVDLVEKKIIFRNDNIKKFSESDVNELNRQTLNFSELIKTFDAVIVSDYDKGTVTPELVEMLRPIPLKVVDSKRSDLSMFKGFDVLKVNESEFNAQSNKPYVIEELFGCCVVTLGDRGSMLRIFEKVDGVKYKLTTVNVPVQKCRSVDVTGCGDTHTAALTISLLKKKDILSAVESANHHASRVVEMFGTSVA
jgi:rfaE bifunctional protein kinase chain/domain